MAIHIFQAPGMASPKWFWWSLVSPQQLAWWSTILQGSVSQVSSNSKAIPANLFEMSNVHLSNKLLELNMSITFHNTHLCKNKSQKSLQDTPIATTRACRSRSNLESAWEPHVSLAQPSAWCSPTLRCSSGRGGKWPRVRGQNGPIEERESRKYGVHSHNLNSSLVHMQFWKLQYHTTQIPAKWN